MMKGSVWCHLSFSSCRKQVCLKYFCKTFPHVDASSCRCAVWGNSVWGNSVREAFRGPKLCCDEFILSKPAERSSATSGTTFYLGQGRVDVSMTFNYLVSFFFWLQLYVKNIIWPNNDSFNFIFLWSLYDGFGRCEGKWMYIFVQSI